LNVSGTFVKHSRTSPDVSGMFMKRIKEVVHRFDVLSLDNGLITWGGIVCM